MLKEYGDKTAMLHRVFDVCVVTVAWYLSYLIRFKLLPDAQQGLFYEFTIVAGLLILSSFYIFERMDLYKSFRLKSVFHELGLVTQANIIIFILLIFGLYFFKDEKLSRIHLVTFFSLSEFLLISSRLIKVNILRKYRNKGRNIRRIKVVGDGNQLKNFVKLIEKSPNSGIEISNKDEDAYVLGFKTESASELEKFLEKHYNDIKPIHILPDISYSLVGHKLEDYDGLPVITVNQPSFSTVELFLKRTIDFLGAGVGLIVISPLLIFVSLGVKLSSKGPIFYGQERIGLDGHLFKMWKFRSMRVATNEEDKTSWSSKDDPRKTKFGSFIRATSIDELPQLWNILIGDMSLVGPRPERPHFVNKFKNEIPNYMLRHKMRAGLTGWAQVNGWRGDTSLVKRIECDIYYIKNWSIWLDVKIILLTFIKGFINKNAY